MERYENSIEQYENLAGHARGKGVSGAVLKNIALVTMLIDHIGAAVLLFFTSYYGSEGQYTQVIDAVYQVLRWIGRTSFPLYCFLLVEGFFHTRNVKKYLVRLFVFALISEFPFNLAFFDSLWYPGAQNVFFTLFLGLSAMAFWRKIMDSQEKLQGFQILIAALAVAVCVVGAYYIRCDYDVSGVCLILIFYFWRNSRIEACIIGYLCMLYEPQSLPAFLLIMAYNGEKGGGKRSKYFFYAFYPLHLCCLYIIRLIILSAIGMH